MRSAPLYTPATVTRGISASIEGTLQKLLDNAPRVPLDAADRGIGEAR